MSALSALEFIDRIEKNSYKIGDRETKDLLETLDVLDLNLRSSRGNYLLHICADWGFHKCISFLIYKGLNKDLNLNVRNINGESPLFLSFRRYIGLKNSDFKKCIDLLLSAGADVNIEDRYGETPLTYAIAYGDISFAKLFILNGGNIFHTNSQFTPVDLIGGLLNMRSILGDQYLNVIDRQLKIKLRVF